MSNELSVRKLFNRLCNFKIVIVLISTPEIFVILSAIHPEFDNARVAVSRDPKTKRVSQGLNVW
eukprot:14090422-Heterocapsa_arctica.AAC.1